MCAITGKHNADLFLYLIIVRSFYFLWKIQTNAKNSFGAISKVSISSGVKAHNIHSLLAFSGKSEYNTKKDTFDRRGNFGPGSFEQ